VSYSSEVLADSPVGYWRLDETSGTNAADSSGGSHDGTYTGGVTLNQASLLASDADASASFDGSNDFVDIPHASALKPSHWTLEAWIYVPNSESTFGSALCGAYDGSSVPFLIGSWDGAFHTLKPSVGFYNGSWHVAQAGSDISKDAVHHIVGTWDGTTLKIYVDGSLANSAVPGSSPTAGNTANLRIGTRWDSSGDDKHFKGRLDEVAIFNTDIGATRIGVHYTAGSTNPAAAPSTVAGVGAVPAPTAQGPAKGSPSATAGVGAVPAVTAKGSSTALSSATAGIGSVPAPTAFASLTAHPSVTAGIGRVPAATAVGAVAASAHPVTVGGVARVPRAHGAGQGTGGGGGSVNGVTDFWAVKALG
jgi:hypothetical protein